MSPRLHVVRVDHSTLPADARLIGLDHASAGDPISRFVDLKRGELHQADFSEGSNSEAVFQAVVARRQRGEIREPARADSAAADTSAPRLLVLGLLQGRLELHSLKLSNLQSVRARDRFEEELRDVAVTGADGKSTAGTRAALFLKGKLKGDYLMTLALDTEGELRERLFRDIQPDEFYPVYGDASVKAYEAQSTGRLYVRVDQRRSYLQYGDYHPPAGDDASRLTRYDRALTGLVHHLETGPVQLDAHASRGRSRQVVEEFPGRGVSGPYVLGGPVIRTNSEEVDVLTRDRNQPSRVLKSVRLQRFSDYQLDPLSGRLVLRSPVPSVDEELDPVSIRITYEVEEGGSPYLVYGLNGRTRLGSSLEAGASALWDEDPVRPWRIVGASAALKLGSATNVIAEVAKSDSGDVLEGGAGRIELRHASSRVDASAFAAHTDADFRNPSSTWSPGRLEIGAHGRLLVDSSTVLRLEGLHTEDRANGGHRDGGEASIERRLPFGLALRFGYRHAQESAEPADTSTVGTTPNRFNSALARASLPLHVGRHSTTLFAEHERDVSEDGRFRTLLGLDHGLKGLGRLYARQEWIRSFAGPYALEASRYLSTTLIGMSADNGRGGQAFTEYRMRDALSGREGAAAIGLRNRWAPARGLRLGTSFERVDALSGAGPAEATAVTAALEFFRDPRSKATLRGEFRDTRTGDDWLSSVGYARKLSRDLALLGKGLWSDAGTRDETHARGQLGFAFRQTDADAWSALARYEYRFDRAGAGGGGGANLRHGAHVLGTDLHHRASRRLSLSGHSAIKFATDQEAGLKNSSRAYWVGLRSLLDLGARWDAALNTSGRWGASSAERWGGLGVEIGRNVAVNLRAAAGYNVFGYKDDDLTGETRTDHGAYLNVGFKFDEQLFGLTSPATPDSTPGRP